MNIVRIWSWTAPIVSQEGSPLNYFIMLSPPKKVLTAGNDLKLAEIQIPPLPKKAGFFLFVENIK